MGFDHCSLWLYQLDLFWPQQQDGEMTCGMASIVSMAEMTSLTQGEK